MEKTNTDLVFKKKYIVYCHTNKINEKKYIGITGQNPKRRWQGGKGYKTQPHFWNAIQKYGWNNFKHEILFDDLTKEEAEAKEIELIAEWKTNQPEYGYNSTTGGEGVHGYVITNEYLQKLRDSVKRGVEHPMYGKHHSEETRKKISIALKNGAAFNTGKPMPEETKRKKSRPVVCLDTGIVYFGVREAERQTGINHSYICACLSGKQKRAGGFQWEYYIEEVA